MPLRVVAPGPLATIQDLGRHGFREFGVPVSGAFDAEALLVVNALLGNDPGCAAIEMTGFGGIFRDEGEPMAVAIAGAPMPARIERSDGPDLPLHSLQTVTMRPGDTLIVGAATSGHRAYLGVKHGWSTPVVMSSRSNEVSLCAGDLLAASPSETPSRHVPPDLVFSREEGPLRYLDGPDASWMDGTLEDLGEFRLRTSSDRMGIRLEGLSATVRSDPARMSAPVAPGAVQVAGGQLLVLGPACGTLGGYPHVGQVISADLDRLAQARPGDALRFQRVDLDEARQGDRQRGERYAQLRLWLATAARL